MLKRIFLLACLLVGVTGLVPLNAQEAIESPQIEWGEIPDHQMAMTAYPADSNAAAVILADVGKVSFRADGTMVFERHTRIKILSESGYEWGTVIIPFYAEDSSQRVRNVKGQTFTARPGDRPQRHKLSRKSVFTEDVDGSQKRIRFTLPALEPGAIIEYAYRIESRSPMFLPGWAFQYGEPTLWSAYTIEIPEGLNYAVAIVGYPDFVIQEQERDAVAAFRVVRRHWAMREVPALREEPLMTTPEDHRAALSFQLASYTDAYGEVVPVLGTWEDTAAELMRNPLFGARLKPGRAIRRQAEALVPVLDDPLDKMIALYDYVRTTIRWSGEYSLAAEKDGDDVLETQHGNSGEIALLLAAMLRAAGIEAHPVLISTRDNGRAFEVYPLLTQFNSVLVAADVGGTTYLLDATDPLRPHDLLSVDALNGRGWLVHPDQPRWISIDATGAYRHKVMLNAALDASGTLTVGLNASDDGYSALEKRRALKRDPDTDAFVADVMLGDLGPVLMTSSTVTDDAGIDAPLRTASDFAVPDYAQVTGDFIYVNPSPLSLLDENPLHAPERRFPVDLAYPWQLSQTTRLELPDGYAVQDAPVSIRLRLPDDGGLYHRVIGVEEGILTIRVRFSVTRTLFEPHQYASLKAFFDRVVAAEAEPVVLKRVDEPAVETVAGTSEGNER